MVPAAGLRSPASSRILPGRFGTGISGALGNFFLRILLGNGALEGEKVRFELRKRGQRHTRLINLWHNMSLSLPLGNAECKRQNANGYRLSRAAFCILLAAFCALTSSAQSFIPQASEYNVAPLFGDQVFPSAALKGSGGYIVFQDNITDGDGAGISARRVDSSFSGALSPFRVNEVATGNQEKPQVSLLNDGGAVFVWQGGRQGYQSIYARFLSANNTFLTGDILVNASTNGSKQNAVVATLTNGTVVVAWASFNQVSSGSFQDVYLQRFSAAGQKLGTETLVNQTTPFNQRTPALAALSDGRFVMVWITEQQRFENSVDVYARIFNASGSAVGSEFLVNSSTNVCANPSVAAGSDGGFVITWAEKDLVVRSDSWDVFARAFSSAAVAGPIRKVNSNTFGDQFAPRVSAVKTDYLVVWTSMGQDQSWEGVYARFLDAGADFSSGEFRMNTTTPSRQIHPTVTSDGTARFLAVWASFVGAANGMDLYAQRYATVEQPLAPPAPPFVTSLDQRRLLVTWPALAGFNVNHYEVYADGAASPSVSVSNNMWIVSAINGVMNSPGSTHTFRLAYVLADGRRSPLSTGATGTTWSYDDNFDGLPDDWETMYWGGNASNWPNPNTDSDGDGVSNRNEFLAGTDPTNPNSVLRVRLSSTPQGLFASWNTEPGLMYQLQSSPDLTSWTNVGGPRFAAGSVDSLTVGAGAAPGYYRIIRLR